MKNSATFIASITCALLFFGITMYSSPLENYQFENFASTVKPLKPNITSHKNNDRIVSSTAIAGTGTPGNTIELHVFSEFKKGQNDFGIFTITVEENGSWTSETLTLWLPEGAENPTFVFTAVQVDADKNRSDEERITVLPESGFLELDKSNLDTSGGKAPPASTGGKGEVIVRDRNIYAPNDTLVQPRIIYPSPAAVITGKTNIQFIGEGVPGATVEIEVELYYTKKYNYIKDFKLSAEVNDDGIWITPYVNPKIPRKAVNIFYRLWIVQIAPDGLRSFQRSETIHQKL